jgi:hypothetical protein
MTIPEYLRIVGTKFEDFHLQRRREKHKAYGRLESDIKNGALLPSITLAVKPERVEGILPAYEAYRADPNKASVLAGLLNTPETVDILDGLQRTYIMRDLAGQGETFMQDQRILVEFWLERELHNLIYRIIVLNAGQKPMSIRHQIELLFASLQDSILRRLPDVEIYFERENTRRTQPKKFAFDVVVTAYQALITGSAEIQKTNLVANELMESSALDLSEQGVSEQFNRFVEMLKRYVQFDEQVARIYKRGLPIADVDDDTDPAGKGQNGAAGAANWLATSNVMAAFFAAVAQFGKGELRRRRVDEALDELKRTLDSAPEASDPLGLEDFAKLRTGFIPRKVNVGLATRRLLTNGFKEFFREGGEVPLAACWTLAAE